MSLAVSPIGDDAIAAQNSAAATAAKKPPPRRQLVAKSDIVTDPEAR